MSLVEALTWMRDRNARDLPELIHEIATECGLELKDLDESQCAEAFTGIRYGRDLTVFPELARSSTTVPVDEEGPDRPKLTHAIELPEDEVLAEPKLAEALARAQERTENVRRALEAEWRKLADSASAGLARIRGKPCGYLEEKLLGADEARNCKYLVWLPDGPGMPITARVERHDGTDEPFDGEWQRMQDDRGPGYDHVFVNRTDLLVLSPLPTRKWALENMRHAEAWLLNLLPTVPIRPKAEILQQMLEVHPMSLNAALKVWRKVTAQPQFSKWRLPGPRKSPD